jgi:hypothetical protein
MDQLPIPGYCDHRAGHTFGGDLAGEEFVESRQSVLREDACISREQATAMYAHSSCPKEPSRKIPRDSHNDLGYYCSAVIVTAVSQHRSADAPNRS